MYTIRQATPGDFLVVRELFAEYLQWLQTRVAQEYAITFDVAATVQHDIDTIQTFLPPDGRLLLAFDGAQVAGCACMRTLHPHIGELKRTYVRPAWRRQGLGRALVQALLGEMREAGYTTVRLDSAQFMHGAHTLYRSLGFREIGAYPESETPPGFGPHLVFMECRL